MHNLPPRGASPIVKIIDNHELEMAKAQVYKAAKCAIELHKMLKYVDNLEGWMQAKITLASEYLDSVSSNLEYDIVSQTMHDDPMPGPFVPPGDNVVDVEVVGEPAMHMMKEQMIDAKEMGKQAQSLPVKNGKVENPHKPGSSEYAKWEQGKREAAQVPVKEGIVDAAKNMFAGAKDPSVGRTELQRAWVRSLMDKGMNRMEAGDIAAKMSKMGYKPQA